MEEFINADTVRNVLNYKDLISLMEKALCKFSDKCVVQPVRSVLHVQKEEGSVYDMKFKVVIYFLSFELMTVLASRY